MLARSIIFLLLSLSACPLFAQQKYIMTVRGKVKADAVGRTLAHEHIVTNFIGAPTVVDVPGDDSVAIAKILPHLLRLKGQGISTLIECTPNYIGRNPALLKKLSELSDLNIVTNTGLYSAVDKKYLPAYAFTQNAASIAARWETEWTNGIGGTGIRPGFIKLGAGSSALDSIEAKMLSAAIMLSRKSLLPIAIHSGSGQAAISAFEQLKRSNWKPEKLIWVHAQNGTDEERAMLANEGVWISLDGVSEKSWEQYASMILFLKKRNLLNRLLISHDDGWAVPENGSYNKLELFGNGNSIPYNTLFTKLLPALQKAGVTESEIDMILRKNTADCFSF